MSKITEAMVEAAHKVINKSWWSEAWDVDVPNGVARRALSAALSAGQAQPVAYTSQPQLDRMAKAPGNNHIMWGEPLPHHADIPLYLHPPVPPAVPVNVEPVAHPLPVGEQLTAEQALQRIADAPFTGMVRTPGWAKEFAAAHLASIRSALPEIEGGDKGDVPLDLVRGDHDRLCQGREYTCTCGYDDQRDAEIQTLRSGIKRLSDEEEMCAETTGDDPFSMVYLAAKLAAVEDARAEQWRLRRDAEGSRDAASAAADILKIERDMLRTALSDILEGWDFWQVNPHDREPPRDAISRARYAKAASEGSTDAN